VFWSVDQGVNKVNDDYQRRLSRLREKRSVYEAFSKGQRPGMRRIQQVSKSNGFPEGINIMGMGDISQYKQAAEERNKMIRKARIDSETVLLLEDNL